ncbi:MAG: SDR family NAD(P)-dependent oxidoreductase, partial [Actinomycetota bacterium]
MDLGLAGRLAIVTGGSKGLGRAITAELMAEGASVVICSRQAGELEKTAAELTAETAGTGTVLAMPCDVTNPEDTAAFVTGAVAALGGLDILVNNAGGARPGTFGTLTDDDWHDDIEVKLFSQIRCIRAALPHLRGSAAPRVININALYARYPDPAFLASSVNRASCLSLSKALSMELGRENILVNSVNIGLVETPQWENIRQR